jgi:glycosyltransferase involved in cell wall biosynthesis
MKPISPLLSVLIITYNHEQYIEQTLKSVLTQKTAFPFEIVIGDDASTDGTRRLCEAYIKKYPHLIRLLPATKNLGVVPNYIRTLNACEGKYIAHLDGDDYWIDPNKLQKQVDRLESDPHLTICYTGRKVYYETNNQFCEIIDGEDNKRYYVEDFADSTFFHLSTIVFRKPTDKKITQHLATFTNIVDRPLSIILLAEMGGYAVKILDICTVFRMNDNSTFTPIKEAKRLQMTNDMYLQLKALYPHLSKNFDHHLNVFYASRCLSQKRQTDRPQFSRSNT